MNYAGHHVISATTPTTTTSPLAVGFLWTDTSGTPALKICTSVSPVTFAAVGGGSVADVNVTFTDNTTGNASTTAHGFLRKLDGTTYSVLRGDGTWAHAFDRGTITASDPFQFSQTFNDAGVTFHGFEVIFTNTASANASTAFNVRTGAGISLLAVRPLDSSLRVGGDIVLTGINSANNAFIGAGGTYSGMYTSPKRTLYWGAVNGIATMSQASAAGGTGIQFQFTGAPTIGSGFGAGAAITANSTDTAGEIDVGTTPGTTGVINFARTWDAAAPFAIVMNKTSGAILTCVATTTTLTITAPVAWANNDKLVWHVIGTNHT